MTISTRVYADGRTVYIRKDADGNTHELNALETKEYLKAKAYKQQLLAKAGYGVAIAGGMAAGEAAISGAAIAGEAAIGVATVAAESVIAPVLAVGACVAAVGFGVWWLIDNAEEPSVDENGTMTVKLGSSSFKVGGTSA